VEVGWYNTLALLQVPGLLVIHFWLEHSQYFFTTIINHVGYWFITCNSALANTFYNWTIDSGIYTSGNKQEE